MRTNSSDHRAVLKAMLADNAVAIDTVPAHYSIRFAAPSEVGSRTQEFHLVYDGSCLAMRTLDARAAVEAVTEMASVHTPLAKEHARVRTTALVHSDGFAVLLPPFVRARAVELERVINRAGFRLVHSDRVRVALHRGELVITPPALDVDWSLAKPPFDIDEQDLRTRIAPGHYPVRRWYLYSEDHQGLGSHLPRGAGLRAAMMCLTGIGDRESSGIATTVNDLVALMAQLEFVAAGDADGEALIRHATESTKIRREATEN